MKSTLKTIGFLSIIPLLICLIFFSNIKGYFRFQHYCEAEGGLRVYEKLERNVGVMVDSYDSAQIATQLKYVDFARFQDRKNNQLYDLHYAGGDPQILKSYIVKPADNSKKTTYFFKNISYFLKDERNLFRSAYLITDMSGTNTLVRYYKFEYLLFIGPLDSRSTKSCFTEGGRSTSDIARWRKDFKNAFKN
ncbi:MAG TPA: hypothetical protein PK002_05990 [Cellvibrio sp.]|nr:hypothetical protein [Cellvibrio sp.]